MNQQHTQDNIQEDSQGRRWVATEAGYQHIPQELTQAPSQGMNVHGNVSRLTATNSYVFGQEPTADPSDPWATARKPSGGKPERITADTLVTFQGFETNVSTLVALGEIQANPDGTYRFKGDPEWRNSSTYGNTQKQPGNENLKPHKGLPSGNQEPLEGLLEPEHEELLNTLIADLPQSSYDQTIIEAIHHDGDLDRINWENLAAITGKSVQEIRQKADFIQSMFHAKAQAVLEQSGIGEGELEDFIQWAKANRMSDYQAAQVELYQGRQTAKAKALASDYLKSAPVPPEADFKAAGYPTKKSSNGELLVFVPDHGWASAEALVRSGAVKRG